MNNLNKFFGLILVLLILVACKPLTEKERYVTSSMPLRQLNKIDKQVSKESGHIFFLVGEYHRSDRVDTFVKMCIKVDSVYRFYEYDINNLNIIINDSINYPYVYCTYDADFPWWNRNVLENYCNRQVFIVCPSIYLPEKLIAIEQ